MERLLPIIHLMISLKIYTRQIEANVSRADGPGMDAAHSTNVSMAQRCSTFVHHNLVDAQMLSHLRNGPRVNLTSWMLDRLRQTN
jgi:hypothetical protein